MKNKKVKIFIITGIILLCLGIMINRIWAYFTTYTSAEGGHTIEIGDTTIEIEEKIDDGMDKHVKVVNTGDFEAFVRVKAFAGDKYTLSYITGSKWKAGDNGYYYYSEVLAPGSTTDELIVKVENSEDEFNVIVVAESTKVLYKENGDPYYDWNATADIN